MKGFETLEASAIPTSSGSTIHAYHSPPSAASSSSPVLVLLHGYPQSSYMWRHVAPSLAKTHSLFIADLPGYGDSTRSTSGDDRMTVGSAVMEALTKTFGKTSIVLIGHDRGGRAFQRVVVERGSFPNVNILGVMLLDIVPYVEQWGSGNAKMITGYFHWPFLANGPQAQRMIDAYGRARFCTDMLERSVGSNPKGKAKMQEGGAWELYAASFDKPSVTAASIADYEAGARKDVDDQVEDQRKERKVDVPTWVMYSERNLGRVFDVEAIWKRWVKNGVFLRAQGVGDDVGHYLPEEAPEVVLESITEFVDMVSKGKSSA